MAVQSVSPSPSLNKVVKKKPPLPPRPNIVEDVSYLKQGFNLTNSHFERPASGSRYKFGSVDLSSKFLSQPQETEPSSLLSSSPGSNRLMGPRQMPTPNPLSQTPYYSGGFALGSPGFTPNTYQSTVSPNPPPSTGFMPMPMPYINLPFNTTNTDPNLSSHSSTYSTHSSIGSGFNSDYSNTSMPSFPLPHKNTNDIAFKYNPNTPPPLPKKSSSLLLNFNSPSVGPVTKVSDSINQLPPPLNDNLPQQNTSISIIPDTEPKPNDQVSPSQTTDLSQQDYFSSINNVNLELNSQALLSQIKFNSDSVAYKNSDLALINPEEIALDVSPLHNFTEQNKITPAAEISEENKPTLAEIKSSIYTASSETPNSYSSISQEAGDQNITSTVSNYVSSGSGDSSPNSKSMSYKRLSFRGKGTGYSFSQHVNHIPPSYNPDGSISVKTSTSSIKVTSRRNSMSSSDRVSSEKHTIPIDDSEEKSETSLLDSLDSSKLSEQGLLILSFTKRELRYFWKMRKLESMIVQNIRLSSIFPDESKEEAIEAILGDLPSLLTSYHHFIDDLTEHLKEEAEGGQAEGYSKIFLRRIEGFAKFVSFAQNMPPIRAYIASAQNNSPRFKLWLQDIEENSLFGNKSLVETLEAVIIRLNYYPSLLEEIKYASSDASEADKMVLDAVIYAFEDLVADLATLRFPFPTENTTNISNEIEEISVIQPDALNWSSAVSESILKSVDAQECKRQEAIFEFIKGEREYVKDLNIIHDLFVGGIKKSPLIASQQHDIIIHKLFFNYTDFMELHLPVSTNLDRRQNQSAVVDQIGDLLLSWSQNLDAYKIYGARVQFASEYCTKERINNQKFAQFLRECEQDKVSRKLSIDSFISLPTRRLARYPLYLKEIRKRTPGDHPDAANLDIVLENISNYLFLLNQTKGETDTKLRLRAISDRLELLALHKGDNSIALELEHPERRLIKEGYLKFIKGSVLVRVFLFDHYLLLAKEYELAEDLFEYQSFKKPVSLNHLTISGTVSAQTIQSHSSTSFFDSVFSSSSSHLPSPELCFSIADSQSNQLFLLAATVPAEKDSWISAITDELNRVM